MKQSGSAHYRTYWEDGETVYVRISGEAPAAVLLDEPAPFADPVGALYFGQRLEVLDDSTTNYVLVSTTGIDEPASGWVWRPALQRFRLMASAGQTDRLETHGGEHAATILNEDGATFRAVSFTNPEREAYAERSENMRSALKRVDEFETGLAHAMGTRWRVERYREFGKAGGLLDE
ncbi:MAG: hypothetical protein K8I27_16075 [Planctomycetes bacterium]|nr:hypothetical protein [Planctomycetota bacterium]